MVNIIDLNLEVLRKLCLNYDLALSVRSELCDLEKCMQWAYKRGGAGMLEECRPTRVGPNYNFLLNLFNLFINSLNLLLKVENYFQEFMNNFKIQSECLQWGLLEN